MRLDIFAMDVLDSIEHCQAAFSLLHGLAANQHKAGDLLGLSRCGLSFPVGFDDEDIVEEALPTDLALIPVLAPEPLTEPDGQPTSNCHKFVTWPVPRCGLLQHADDSYRFLKRKIVFTRARCNDFAQLLTKRIDLCVLHVLGDLLPIRATRSTEDLTPLRPYRTPLLV